MCRLVLDVRLVVLVIRVELVVVVVVLLLLMVAPLLLRLSLPLLPACCLGGLSDPSTLMYARAPVSASDTASAARLLLRLLACL